MNKLLFGDNLKWLQDRKLFSDACVDLVYLDPPFNSNADYNVLFKEASGEASQAQFHAFTDTWTWADAAETYNEFVDTCPNIQVVELMQALHSFLKTSPMMSYLAMMAPRLVELHRVLKPTGSLYLHCDPTASHYLRMVLDCVFGAKTFGRKSSGSEAAPIAIRNRVAGSMAAFMTRSSFTQRARIGSGIQSTRLTMNLTSTLSIGISSRKPGGVIASGDLTGPGGAAKGNPSYEVLGVTRFWRYTKEKMTELIRQGRIIQTKPGAVPAYKRYLDEMPGVPLQDWWGDIGPIGAQAAERLGYPTQKPLALLERIIESSSNPGDIVLDPFCGCGTATHAAQKLGRQWIGIDITYLAINLIKRRLRDAFGKKAKYEEFGQPTDFKAPNALPNWTSFSFSNGRSRSLKRARSRKATAKARIAAWMACSISTRARPSAPRSSSKSKAAASNAPISPPLLGDVNNQKAAAGVLLTLEKALQTHA